MQRKPPASDPFVAQRGPVATGGVAAVRQPEKDGQGQNEETATRNETREQRVAELRAKFREGSYAVDARELASKLIEKHRR